VANRKVAVPDKRMSMSISLPIHLVQDLCTLAESKNLPVSREAELAIRDHLAAVRELAVA
jgi:hypothetical protein